MKRSAGLRYGENGDGASPIRAVDRVVDIVDCLASDDRQWTLSLIARRVDLPASTVHRFLSALEQRQMVYRHPDSDVYTLGYRLLAYADRAQKRVDLRQMAMPELYRLRDETQATAALYVRSGGQRVNVASVQSPGEFCLVPEIGGTAPLHVGCFSKAILAFLPTPERSHYMAGVLGMNGNALGAELDRVARLGYSISSSEAVVGAAGAAAPVFQHGDRVIASVGVLMPVQHLPREREPDVATRVCEAANRISVLLGGQQMVAGSRTRHVAASS